MLMLGFPIESEGAAAAVEVPLPFMAKAAPAPAAPASNAMTSHFLLLCGASPGDAFVTDTLGGGIGAGGVGAPE